MAQRERAGLITPRSLDQSQLPVFYIRRFTRTYHAVNTATHFTGMAQRQRVGLITPRSLDRDELPVFSYSRALQKLAVPLDVKQA